MDVVCRLITVGGDGHECLAALRRLTAAPLTIFSDNGVLPMLREIQFYDITLGIFPYAGLSMSDVFGPSVLDLAKNSVGDLMDLLLQALEVGNFIIIHSLV